VAAGGLRLEVDDTEDTAEAKIASGEMEEAAKNAAAPRLFMFEGDQEFVEALLRKYAKDDYAKMARDMKINTYQVEAGKRLLESTMVCVCACTRSKIRQRGT